MPIRHGGRLPVSSSSLARFTAGRCRTIFPSASAPCSANMFLARSMPSVTISMISAPGLVDEFPNPVLAIRCRFARGFRLTLRPGRESPFHSLTITMTTKTQSLRFKYGWKPFAVVILALVVFSLTAGMAYIAHTVPDVRFTRLLSKLVSPEAPAIAYWTLTAITGVLSVLGVAIAIKAAGAVTHVELNSTGALLPSASLSSRPFLMPYKSIRQIQVVEVQGHPMAVISSTVGESRVISKQFASPKDFSAFLLALEQRRHG